MKRNVCKTLAMVIMAVFVSACTTQSTTKVERTEALDASAWETSQWISAVDAPVVTGKTGDMENNRAADGASWFVSTVKNEQKVTCENPREGECRIS